MFMRNKAKVAQSAAKPYTAKSSFAKAAEERREAVDNAPPDGPAPASPPPSVVLSPHGDGPQPSAGLSTGYRRLAGRRETVVGHSRRGGRLRFAPQEARLSPSPRYLALNPSLLSPSPLRSPSFPSP